MDASVLARYRTKFGECLAENDARVFDRSETGYVSLTGDAELWRHWPDLSPDYIPDACEYLNIVTSVKNLTPQKYVDDPTASGEVFRGRWRQAYLRRIEQGDVIKLVQVLRKGYAFEISWDEARLVEGRDLLESEHYRTIRWVNIAREKVHSLAAALNDSTYPDPVVGGETLTGTWHNIYVVPSIADDGSGIITMLLAEPEFTLTAYQAHLSPRSVGITYLWQVPKDLAQDVLDTYKAFGRSASASYPNAAGLVDIVIYGKDEEYTSKLNVITSWNCSHKEYTDYYWGLTEDDADSIVLTKPPVGWTYEARKSMGGDGYFDVIIVKRNTLPRSYTYVAVSEAGDSTVEMCEQIGVDSDDVEEVAEIVGAVVSQQRRHNDDCTVNANTNKDTGKAQESKIIVVSPAGTTTTTIKTVQEAKLADPVKETGHIKRVENRESRYVDRYDTSEQDSVPEDQTSTSYAASMASETATVLHTEAEEELEKPTAIKGTIYRRDSRPTEAGRYQTTDQEIVPTDQVSTSYDASMASETETVLHTENPDVLDKPTPVKGTIVRQQSSQTEAGNERTIVQTITPTDQVSTSYDVSKASETETVLHTENPDMLDKPTPVKGTIVRQSSRPTEAGNEQTVVQTITPTDQISTSYDASKASETETVLHTENPDVLDKPTPTKGTIVRQQSSQTEAGNERTIVQTIVPKDQVSTSYEGSAMVDSERVIHTENETPLDEPEETEGVVVRQSSQPTEAGNDRTTVETITCKKLEGVETWEDQYGTSYRAWGRYCSAAEVAAAKTAAGIDVETPAATSSTNNSLTTEATEFPDKFHYTITKMAIPQYWSVAGVGPLEFDFAAHDSEVRETTYLASQNKMEVTQWVRWEKFFRDRDDAVKWIGYLNDTTTTTEKNEKPSIVHYNLAGGIWLAVKYIRKGTPSTTLVELSVI